MNKVVRPYMVPMLRTKPEVRSIIQLKPPFFCFSIARISTSSGGTLPWGGISKETEESLHQRPFCDRSLKSVACGNGRLVSDRRVRRGIVVVLTAACNYLVRTAQDVENFLISKLIAQAAIVGPDQGILPRIVLNDLVPVGIFAIFPFPARSIGELKRIFHDIVGGFAIELGKHV